MRRTLSSISRVLSIVVFVVAVSAMVNACTDSTAPTPVATKQIRAPLQDYGCDGNWYDDESQMPTCTECQINQYGQCDDGNNDPCAYTQCYYCGGICLPSDQTVAFTSSPPVPAYVGGSYTPTAAATFDTLGYYATITSLTPSTCTITSGVVALAALGTCTLAADQEGDHVLLAPAPQVTQSFEIVAQVFPFTGFLPPLASSTRPNVATAGSTIPVKFSLGGNRGLDILAAGSPSSANVSCTGGAAGAFTSTNPQSKSGLAYDASSGIYNYTWATKKEWKGTCRVLTVSLTDGTSHSVTIIFK